jgi:hypothetical protein
VNKIAKKILHKEKIIKACNFFIEEKIIKSCVVVSRVNNLTKNEPPPLRAERGF